MILLNTLKFITISISQYLKSQCIPVHVSSYIKINYLHKANKTKKNKIEQNKAKKQNKTKQQQTNKNKTKQNKNIYLEGMTESPIRPEIIILLTKVARTVHTINTAPI